MIRWGRTRSIRSSRTRGLTSRRSPRSGLMRAGSGRCRLICPTRRGRTRSRGTLGTMSASHQRRGGWCCSRPRVSSPVVGGAPDGARGGRRDHRPACPARTPGTFRPVPGRGKPCPGALPFLIRHNWVVAEARAADLGADRSSWGASCGLVGVAQGCGHSCAWSGRRALQRRRPLGVPTRGQSAGWHQRNNDHIPRNACAVRGRFACAVGARAVARAARSSQSSQSVRRELKRRPRTRRCNGCHGRRAIPAEPGSTRRDPEQDQTPAGSCASTHEARAGPQRGGSRRKDVRGWLRSGAPHRTRRR